MRSGRAVSAAGASESVASVRAEADSFLPPRAKPRVAGRREHWLPQARDSVRPAPAAFSGAWTSASGSVVGHEGSNASVRRGAQSPSASSERSEAQLGALHWREFENSIRPAPQRFRAPGARLQARSSTTRRLGFERLVQRGSMRLPHAPSTHCPRTQRRSRSPRPTRQSRDSPKIRADGRTSARRTARSAGAGQARRAGHSTATREKVSRSPSTRTSSSPRSSPTRRKKSLDRLAVLGRVGSNCGDEHGMDHAKPALLVEGPEEARVRRRRTKPMRRRLFAQIRRRHIFRRRSFARLGKCGRNVACGAQRRNRHQKPGRASRPRSADAAQIDADRPPVDDKAHLLETRRLANGKRRRQMAQTPRRRSLAPHQPSFERLAILGAEQSEHGRARAHD